MMAIVVSSRMLKVSGMALLFHFGCVASPSRADVVSDGQTPTNVRIAGGDTTVGGGLVNGGNVFHSFEEFSVPGGMTVTFEENAGVSRIINRVTGSTESFINGEIRYAGADATIFLLNPNGVVFGPQSKLDINASFVASSAEGLLFEDGTFYGVGSNSAETPLLTSSIPVGLQFGDAPQSVRSLAGSASDEALSSSVGLTVPSGQTIALVGGGISIQGDLEVLLSSSLEELPILKGLATLSAPGGRLELGS
ncbi:MAG: filamentous hemagglutinin N-terminal domain-containing protein, partial [Cyanobacteria bacterium J06639_1]